MDVKEYLLSLMAIVTGLAIADMIRSLHGLLRRFRKVRWDWLPVVAAFFVFVLIVASWWTSWTSEYEAMPLLVFLIIMFQLVALFLAAKAVLPDDREEGPLDPLDLLDHYRGSNRYVWLSLTALLVLFLLPSVVDGWSFAEPARLISLAWVTLIAVVFLVLACVQRMILHRILVPGLLIMLLVQGSASIISSPA